ncbi:MAG TPA: hypothetical protein VI386_02615 [Candidatus Sulfotelmatobacter sp.]
MASKRNGRGRKILGEAAPDLGHVDHFCRLKLASPKGHCGTVKFGAWALLASVHQAAMHIVQCISNRELQSQSENRKSRSLTSLIGILLRRLARFLAYAE